MALIVPEESQRPYRFGMTLVCIGALFNWLGLADHHTKPVPAVRYIGVGLVASGAVLICMAMCFWMNSVRDDDDEESIDHIQVISLDPPVRLDEKPPDYASVVDLPPPSYDDAVKLDPQRLLMMTAVPGDSGRRSVATVTDTCTVTIQPDECDKASAETEIDGMAATAGQQPTTATTILAHVIRKSIRDIRKQLTNTVGDIEQHQPQLQQSGSVRDTSIPTASKSDSRQSSSNPTN